MLLEYMQLFPFHSSWNSSVKHWQKQKRNTSLVGTKTQDRSLWIGLELPLHPCSCNSCFPRPTEGTCPPCPRHDQMWHGIRIPGAWEENCLGHMELVSRTDRFPSHHASQYPGWHNALQWKVCGVLLWPHKPTYECRYLFAETISVQRIPATYGDSVKHVKRSAFQSGYI